MASRPLDTPFTPREILFGGLLAAALWVGAAGLLVALAAWSLAPRLVA